MTEALTPSLPIFIVDDEPAILTASDTTLRLAGFNNIVLCQDSRKVEDLLVENSAEVILLDLLMPHIGGQELLMKMASLYPEIPVIIITGAKDVENAVKCMQMGAIDYLVKPVENERLITSIKQAMNFGELKRENIALKEQLLNETVERSPAFSEFITQNKKILALFQYMESIAKTSQPVLITGETGVGKELAAKGIHALSSLAGPFLAVNVAGLDDNVFSDTLFGHAKGAFTGAEKARSGLVEQAAGGTLFLDEIGDLSQASQTKLLRLLQEGEYLSLGEDIPRYCKARILTATNQDLRHLETKGRFRADLIHRLRTHHVIIPPLRQRMDDLVLLINHFLEESALALEKPKPTPPKELVALLRTYSFPGNIRELKSIIFDAVSRHKTKILSLDTFKNYIYDHPEDTEDGDQSRSKGKTKTVTFSDSLPTIDEISKLLVDEAMVRATGNQSIASKMLGISQQALSKRLQKYKS